MHDYNVEEKCLPSLFKIRKLFYIHFGCWSFVVVEGKTCRLHPLSSLPCRLLHAQTNPSANYVQYIPLQIPKVIHTGGARVREGKNVFNLVFSSDEWRRPRYV